MCPLFVKMNLFSNIKNRFDGKDIRVQASFHQEKHELSVSGLKIARSWGYMNSGSDMRNLDQVVLHKTALVIEAKNLQNKRLRN